MPTVLRNGPYRFFFYAGDLGEPPHVHVERDNNAAKFWIEPIRLQKSSGFSRKEINRIRSIIEQHHKELNQKWHEYFNN